MEIVTRTWKVYGIEGHRQAESFNPSERYDFSDGETEYRIETKKDLIGDGLSFDEALYCVKPLFSGENDCKLIVFDKKALKHTLEEFNVKIDDKVVCDDVMLQKYVVDYTQKELSATECVERAGLNAKTPAFSLTLARTTPSAAILDAFLAAVAIPFSLKKSTALSISPLVSVKAFLQSKIPAPVF